MQLASHVKVQCWEGMICITVWSQSTPIQNNCTNSTIIWSNFKPRSLVFFKRAIRNGGKSFEFDSFMIFYSGVEEKGSWLGWRSNQIKCSLAQNAQLRILSILLKVKTFDITHISLAGEFKEKQIEILILRTFFSVQNLYPMPSNARLRFCSILKLRGSKNGKRDFSFWWKCWTFFWREKLWIILWNHLTMAK